VFIGVVFSYPIVLFSWLDVFINIRYLINSPWLVSPFTLIDALTQSQAAHAVVFVTVFVLFPDLV